MDRTDWRSRKNAHLDEWAKHSEIARNELDVFIKTLDFEHFNKYKEEMKIANRHYGVAMQIETKHMKTIRIYAE